MWGRASGMSLSGLVALSMASHVTLDTPRPGTGAKSRQGRSSTTIKRDPVEPKVKSASLQRMLRKAKR